MEMLEAGSSGFLKSVGAGDAFPEQGTLCPALMIQQHQPAMLVTGEASFHYYWAQAHSSMHFQSTLAKPLQEGMSGHTVSGFGKRFGHDLDQKYHVANKILGWKVIKIT